MEKEVSLIIKKHFDQTPKEIVRMKAGICNEVYKVQLEDKSVIVRMNKLDRFLKGSAKNIPIFRSKNISVPEIFFEDYSRSSISEAYQIMTVIEGEDLGKVIHTLTQEQLKEIAKEISNILIKLSDIPTNGKFGWVDDTDTKLLNSWSEVMLRAYNDVVDRNNKTGVVGKEFIDLYSKFISEYKEYFDKVPSKFVYDDLSSKNVIIKDGKFTGLVDLDQIMYGDFLEPVGRIMASWYGTEYGKVYTQAVMDYLTLDDTQRKTVHMYAILNRINWLSEIGIQFNQNTSTVVDPKRVEESKKIIELLRSSFPR